MDLKDSRYRDTILEMVRHHIPTIDSDSSSSENEETDTVCQRPTGSLQVHEDAQLSMDDEELQMLNKWSLDDVLQNVKVDELGQGGSAEPLTTHEGLFSDADSDRSQDIMEKLVAFCNSQSSQSASEPVKSPNHIRLNNIWDKSSELQLSQQERPTVYMDLRCPDPSRKLPRTSHNLSSESPPAKKHNLRVHAGSRTGNGEATGKSLLLQKINEMNRNGNKYTDPPHSAPGSEEEEEEEAEEEEEEEGMPVESACSHESQHQPSHGQFEHRNPEVEKPATTQRRPVREVKQPRDQHRRVQQTLQHEQHQKILKQLETHRPQKSVNQKQPAAERTDVLYDFEASHLQPISPLPADVETKSHMLLIVDLSGPGVVRTRAHGREKHLEPAATKSDIYNTLVAWFLSLVGPEPRHDEDQVHAAVPFWVAGLQQLWSEDGLVLHVLAGARHSYTPKKRNRDVRTLFYQNVRRFLSETTLPLVARWIPQLRTLLDQQNFSSPIHLPSSCLSSFISTTSNKKVIDRTFGLSPGFYWQTVETQQDVCKGRETTQQQHTEVSVALGRKAFLLHPLRTHFTLQLVRDSGLDVCGLRLLYPPPEFLSDPAGADPVLQRTDESCQPVLALAVRGLRAHSVLKDLTSFLDPLMPRETDLKPLEPPLLFCSRPASQVHRDLCLWFSGRLPRGSAQTGNRVGPDRTGSSRTSSSLCATAEGDVLLVVSPAVPPCFYVLLLSVCERRGFGLLGLQRMKLQNNSAAVLGLSDQQVLEFCSPRTETLDPGQLELPCLCLLLLLRKENAALHRVSLPAALMRELKVQKLLGCILSRLDGIRSVEPSSCFHTVLYRSKLHHNFVRWMWAMPDPSSVILSHQKCRSDSDLEQLVIVTLCGMDLGQGLGRGLGRSLGRGLGLLHRALTGRQEGGAGFQLLGLKWLPALTRLQAQELSPYEVGQQLCGHSVDRLTSSPALVCALRRTHAVASLRKLLPADDPADLSVLMSPTPEVALRQAALFFFEREMIPGLLRAPSNISDLFRDLEE